MLFANFAEALAEGRGKAQADALRATRTTTIARKLVDGARGADARARTSARATCVVCEAGDVIPADGEIVEGIASRRRVGHHRRVGARDPRGGRRPLESVTGGTRVLSDRIVIRDHRRTRARRSSTA